MCEVMITRLGKMKRRTVLHNDIDVHQFVSVSFFMAPLRYRQSINLRYKKNDLIPLCFQQNLIDLLKIHVHYKPVRNCLFV